MKKYLYLLLISFSATNCYTYKLPAAESDKPLKERRDVKPTELAADAVVNPQTTVSAMESKAPKKSKIDKEKSPRPTDVKQLLEANKYFKIEVGDKAYKIQVDKWESDTLVAHVIHKPKRILKFHKNQINKETIAERRFSQRTADIITVVSYAAIGVGIWALVR